MAAIICLFPMLVLFNTLFLVSCASAQLLNFVQNCSLPSFSSLDNPKTYTCAGRTERGGLTLTEKELPSNSVLSFCRFIGCGTLVVKVNITLKNVAFEATAGSAMRIESGYSLMGDNLNFTHITTLQDGGGILLMPNSRANLTFCLFQNTTANAALAGGGAIAVRENANLYISSSQFINNTASYRGGSIYIYAGATVELNHVHFTAGKVVTSRGGDVYSSGGTLIWNYGSSIGITQDYAKFMNNGTHQGPSGGSIGIDSAGRISLNHVRFENQRVQLYGAVLYSDNGVAGNNIKIDIKNMTTLNTHADTLGGVMYLASLSNTDVTCTDCRFTNAFAKESAGAIVTNGKLLLDNITSQNSTIYKGPGSFLGQSETGNLIIRNSLINGSTFTYYDDNTFNAGAMLLQGNVTIINSTFSHNQADMGGAIFYYGSLAGEDRRTVMNVTDTLFFKNKAKKSTGAVIIANTKSIWTNVKFDSNQSKNYSGAIEFQIYNRLAFPAVFYGKFECYNNTVLNDVEGSAGCMAADTQTALHFKTNQLFFKDNKAVYGSDVFMSCHFTGNAQGNLTYEPEDMTRPGPVLTGTWYFFREEFAAYIASTRVLDRMDPNLKVDSRPMGAILKYEEDVVRLNNSALALDVEIPSIHVMLSNMFRKQLITVISRPTIVKMTLETKDGKRLATAHRLVHPNDTEYSTVFKSVYLSRDNLPENFDSFVNMTFVAINHNPDGVEPKIYTEQTATLFFNVPECRPDIATVVPLYVKTNGKTVHGCLNNFSVSKGNQTLFFALSLIAIVMAIGMGGVAHMYRDMNVYRTFSSFFTNLITVGCIIQFASISIRSWASQTFKEACMVSESLELLGFALVLSSIIVKTYRIRAIFIRTLQHRGSPESISNAVLGLYVLVAMILTLVFVLAWSLTRPLTVGMMHLGGSNGFVQTDRCRMNGQGVNFTVISVALHILLILIAVYFAHVCRNVPSTYNETKTILMVSYSWLIGSAVLYPLAEFLLLYPNPSFILHCVRIYAPNMLTLCLIHLPRMYVALFRKELDPKKNSIFNSSKDKSTKKSPSSAKASSGSHISDIIVRPPQNNTTGTQLT